MRCIQEAGFRLYPTVLILQNLNNNEVTIQADQFAQFIKHRFILLINFSSLEMIKLLNFYRAILKRI